MPKLKEKPSNAKWDWDLFDALYFAGMEPSQIVKEVPDFDGLSVKYAQNHVFIARLATTRREMRFRSREFVAMNLARMLDKVAEHHQRWIAQRLDIERKCMDSMLISARNQPERLNSLKLIDEMTRRLTGLDNVPPPNVSQRVFGALLIMQQDEPLRIGEEKKKDKYLVDHEAKLVNESTEDHASNPTSDNGVINTIMGDMTMQNLPQDACTGLIIAGNGITESGQREEKESVKAESVSESVEDRAEHKEEEESDKTLNQIEDEDEDEEPEQPRDPSFKKLSPPVFVNESEPETPEQKETPDPLSESEPGQMAKDDY